MMKSLQELHCIAILDNGTLYKPVDYKACALSRLKYVHKVHKPQ